MSDILRLASGEGVHESGQSFLTIDSPPSGHAIRASMNRRNLVQDRLRVLIGC